jgi:hypothetical protein
MRKPWKDAEKNPPKKNDAYLVVVAMFGGRVDEELRIEVYGYNAKLTPPWRGEYNYIQSSRVIAWTELPALPRQPKKARILQNR